MGVCLQKGLPRGICLRGSASRGCASGVCLGGLHLRLSDTMENGQRAIGMHPSGMHFCSLFVIYSQLIAFVEGNSPFVWQGYMYAVGMFVVSVVGCLFMHHSFYISYNTGLRVRTAVITAIYRKVNTSKINCSDQEILGNHLSLLPKDVVIRILKHRVQ